MTNDQEIHHDRDLIIMSIILSAGLIFGTLCCVGSFLWAVFS